MGNIKCDFLMKEAQKGFQPLSAIKEVEYFQNLRNFLKNCLGNFLEGFFGRKIFGGFFWEDFFGRNSFFTLLKSTKLFEYGNNLFVCQDFGFCQDFSRVFRDQISK